MISLKSIQKLHDKSDFHNFISVEYDNDIDFFLLEVSRHLNALYRKSISEADKFLTTVLTCIKYIPDQHQFRLYSMQARLALWKADYQIALSCYKKALKKTTANRDFRASAIIQKGMIEVFMYLSRYEEGLASGIKALNYFKRKNEALQAAQVMTNIGNVYHRMDKNRLALQYYDKAKEIFAEEGGMACAIVDYNRANIYTNLNQLEKAKLLYLEAGSFYKKSQMELAFQQAQYSIAYILFLESRYTDALSQFEKVYDAFESLGDHAAAAISQLDLAELNLQLNQYGSTIMLTELIIPIFKKCNMPYESGKAYYFGAIAKLALGEHAQAKKMIQTAKRIFTREKNDLWLGMIEQAKSTLYTDERKFSRAVEASVNAKRYFNRSKDIRRGHDAEIAHLQALFLSKKIKAAFSLLRKLNKKQITIEQKRKIHAIVGEYYFTGKEYGLAIKEFRRSTEIVESMMNSISYDEIKYFFAADKYILYSRLVECYLKTGKIEYAYLQNLNALSLLNKKISSSKIIKNNLPDEIITQIESLRQTLSQVYKFPQKGKRASLSSYDILKKEKQLWHLEQKARAYTEIRDEHNRNNHFDIPLYTPKEDELIVSYFITADKVGAFVRDNTRLNYIDIESSLADIQALTRKTQFLFEQTVHHRSSQQSLSVQKTLLKKLYAALLAPLKISNKIKIIYIIPDSIINQVPFIALCDIGGVYVKDKYTVKIIADPSSLSPKRRTSMPFSKRHNAIFSVTTDTLPLVETECLQISSVFNNAATYSNEAANTQNFISALNRSSGFIHVASHASRSSENPLFSRILFSDGVFYPFDLYGQGINAELVTLSGCQTAAPGLNYGNTFSLAKTFYRAGCRFVLASLWPVDDKVTMLFMNRFYNRLSHHNSVEKAYTEAVKYISEKIEDAAFWGAFVLIGN